MIKYNGTSQVHKIKDFLSDSVLNFIFPKNIDERNIVYVLLERPSYKSIKCPRKWIVSAGLYMSNDN